MKILPVLDLLDGVVVRGIAGRRDEYRPIQSCLTQSSDALDVARAIREQLGLAEFYVADLDAIIHNQPSFQLYRTLSDAGFGLMIDAGLRETARAREVIKAGAAAVIAGLETSAGPSQLRELCDEFGPDRIIFSLDLKAGKPLGDLAVWMSREPFAIAEEAVESGIQRIIVLDLAQVGVGQGLSTTDLSRQLIAAFPALQVTTGGGIRDANDLRAVADAGIHAILVASALHDGRITRADILGDDGSISVGREIRVPADATMAESMLRKLATDPAASDIVLDLCDVADFSDRVFAAILLLHQRVTSAGGSCILRNARPGVLAVARQMNLNRILVFRP